MAMGGIDRIATLNGGGQSGFIEVVGCTGAGGPHRKLTNEGHEQWFTTINSGTILLTRSSPI